MTKSAAQLQREIAAAVAPRTVSVKKLFAWLPKLKDTVYDIRAGRVSYSTGQPLTVSQLDTPRGAFFILDGHHRAVEAVLAKRPEIAIEINPHVPRIERTGDAYRSVVAEKANVADFVKGLKR